MLHQGKYIITGKRSLARGVFSIDILCPEIARDTKPGQFAQVSAEGFFLRRPISICSAGEDSISLVFEIRGKGTEKIAELNRGQAIDLLAPLGNGFRLPEEGMKCICVGGGIGTPPMVGIAGEYGERARVISGFRDKAAVILQEDFKALGCETILCTDDGSAGRKGFVTEALRDELEREKPDIIYACGPMVMLKGVAKLAEEYGVPCQVSLEQRMACGVGACLVCVCETEKDGARHNSHVCKDGPVFDSKEVVF